jgi:hypothetical protein
MAMPLFDQLNELAA